MKKIIIVIILAIVLIGLFSYRIKIKNLWLEMTKEELPVTIEYQQPDVATQNVASEGNNTFPKNTTQNQIPEPTAGDKFPGSEGDTLPISFNLDVPFTSQAPHADWNETFKEGCEEASALMIDYFYNDKVFTPDAASDEIIKMVEWQLDYFGGHFDLTAEQTAKMIKEYWGYEKVEVIDEPTIDDIKYHISQKRPVIVPAAGRELGNPYFRQPGPIYHMLVIKGYTETQFITNDPGTKRGENFLYDYDVLMMAIHDWDEDDIIQGEKRIIVIFPN